VTPARALRPVPPLPVRIVVTGIYTIQVAAMAEASNARELMEQLRRAGFDAYLIEPGAGAPDTLYRVRVGKYQSRASAQRAVARLEGQLGLKMWITRTR
jgi:cell division septation protein DedD